MGEWILACGRDDIPEGQMRGMDLGGQRILLANVGGVLSATDLICTHAEADLSNGFLTEEGVRCPLHLSIFDLQNGKPKNPPAESPIRVYNIKIDGGSIYVEV